MTRPEAKLGGLIPERKGIEGMSERKVHGVRIAMPAIPVGSESDPSPSLKRLLRKRTSISRLANELPVIPGGER